MTAKEKAIEVICHMLGNNKPTKEWFEFARKHAISAANYTADQIALNGGVPKGRIYFWSEVADEARKLKHEDFVEILKEK